MTSDIDQELAATFKLKLELLDQAHARARTPKQRRRIERQIQAVHQELADIVAKGQKVDRAFQDWVRTLNPPKGTA